MSEKFINPEDCTSIEMLETEVKKVFLLRDAGVVKMVAATIIANRMDLDPVWLLLVAPPSGGKTELIQAISGLDFVHGISDLTVNTFASGQKKTGKETSLLLKINNGIMAFKDFTSILAKNREARQEIMKQLREIFDGEYIKRTGTGDDVTWRGKVGAIAGSTEAVYGYIEDMSAMGDRFIMYSVEQADRIEVSRRMLSNANDIHEKRAHLRQCFEYFILYTIDHMTEEDVQLEESMKEEFLRVADFATRARSAVMTDFKSGRVTFVPTPEMPPRMASQLYTLGSAFVTMNRSNPILPKDHPAHQMQLTADEKRILFKTAFDSIPRTRRNAIYPLAKYTQGVTTAGLATFLDLPSESVKTYLQQLNALGICTRSKHTAGRQGDLWRMKDQYMEIMQKIEDFTPIDGMLMSETSDIDDDEGWDTFDSYQKSKEEEASLDIDL